MPASTWDAILSHINDPDDAARLADSARTRMLDRYAIPLYRRAANAGNEDAALRLAELLTEHGDLDKAAQRRLHAILVELIPNEDQARRIADHSRVWSEVSGVAWSLDPTSFWEKVLASAHRTGKMESLFAAVDEVLGENPDWREAKEEYRAACEARVPVGIGQGIDPGGTAVDHSLLERRLRDLRDALGQVCLAFSAIRDQCPYADRCEYRTSVGWPSSRGAERSGRGRDPTTEAL